MHELGHSLQPIPLRLHVAGHVVCVCVCVCVCVRARAQRALQRSPFLRVHMCIHTQHTHTIHTGASVVILTTRCPFTRVHMCTCAYTQHTTHTGVSVVTFATRCPFTRVHACTHTQHTAQYTACNAGYGTSACSPCLTVSYSLGSGTAACTTCPEGCDANASTYNVASGCVECKPGYVSSQWQSACVNALLGSASL